MLQQIEWDQCCLDRIRKGFMAESRDPLRNGAIFRVKDLSVLRGKRTTDTHRPLTSEASDRVSPLDHLPSVIRSRFDELYRATPMPTFGPFQTLQTSKVVTTSEKPTFKTPQFVFPYPTSTSRPQFAEIGVSPHENKGTAEESKSVTEPLTVEPGSAIASASQTEHTTDSSKLGATSISSVRVGGSKRRLGVGILDTLPRTPSREPEPSSEAPAEVNHLSQSDTSNASPEKALVAVHSPAAGSGQSKSPQALPLSNKRSRMRMQDSSLLSLVDKARPDSSPATPHPGLALSDSSGIVKVTRAKEKRNTTSTPAKLGRNEGYTDHKLDTSSVHNGNQKSFPQSQMVENPSSWTADEDRQLREAHKATKINAGESGIL